MRLLVPWRFLILSAFWQERGRAQPVLPDLVTDVNDTLQGRMPSAMVAAPAIILPTEEELEKMSAHDASQRQHFYFSAFFFSYVAIVGAGTGIMVMGPKLKRRWQHGELVPDDAPQEEARQGQMLSTCAQKLLVGVVFGMNFLISLTAAVWSLRTRRLSNAYFMDWEILLALFIVNGLWMLVQACLAVRRAPPGRAYGSIAFAEGTLTSMMPILSDAYDTLRDVTFGALCVKSVKLPLKLVGVISWAYLLLIHLYFIFYKDVCSAELSAAYLPVLLAATEPQGGTTEQSEGSLCTRLLEKIMPIVLKQTTPAKRRMLLIENLPQAVFSVFYLMLEGGNWLVAIMNVALPAAQYSLAWVLHKPLQRRLAPWFAWKLDAALEDGNTLAELQIRDAAVISNDRELFLEIARHCRAFQRAVPELADSDLSEGMEAKLQVLCCEYITLFQKEVQEADLSRHMISGCDFMGDFLRRNPTLRVLHLANNRITDVNPFGRVLEVNTGLQVLDIRYNQIADADPMGRALELNGTLQELNLSGNSIESINVLASGLAKNASLRVLNLGGNRIADIDPLGRALDLNGTLQELYFGGNSITSTDALASALTKNASLRVLDLDSNRIANVNPLGRALEVNVVLQVLDLSFNRIADVNSLGRALEANTALQVLSLSENRITDAKPLGHALETNRSLQELTLRRNQIRSVAGLAVGLAGNGALRELNLTRNPVNDLDSLPPAARVKVKLDY